MVGLQTKRATPVLPTPNAALTQTHEVDMRQAMARVARGFWIFTCFLFDLFSALLVLFLVALHWGVQ